MNLPSWRTMSQSGMRQFLQVKGQRGWRHFQGSPSCPAGTPSGPASTSSRKMESRVSCASAARAVAACLISMFPYLSKRSNLSSPDPPVSSSMITPPSTAQPRPEPRRMGSLFERYLTVWVGLCILGGILLGKAAPDSPARWTAWPLRGRRAGCLHSHRDLPVLHDVSDHGEDRLRLGDQAAGARSRCSDLFVNWAIKPFTMYAIALLFLGVLFRGFIGVRRPIWSRCPSDSTCRSARRTAPGPSFCTRA